MLESVKHKPRVADSFETIIVSGPIRANFPLSDVFLQSNQQLPVLGSRWQRTLEATQLTTNLEVTLVSKTQNNKVFSMKVMPSNWSSRVEKKPIVGKFLQ